MRPLLLLLAAGHGLLGLFFGGVAATAAYRAWAVDRPGGVLLPVALALAICVLGGAFVQGAWRFLRQPNRSTAVDVAVMTMFVIWALGGRAAQEAMRLEFLVLFGPLGKLGPFALWSFACYAFYRWVFKPAAERAVPAPAETQNVSE